METVNWPARSHPAVAQLMLTIALCLSLGNNLFVRATAFGQEVGSAEFDSEEAPIESDRNSFTRSPRVVERSRWVVEGSYTFLDRSGASSGHLFPDLLSRYGVNEWFELRLGWTYEIGKVQQLLPQYAEREEEGIITYGAKIQLTTGYGWLPTSSLITTGYTPTSGMSNDTDFSLEYAAGWELPSRWEVRAGLRWFLLSEEEDRYTEWAPSVMIRAPCLSQRAGIHVEYFSLLSVDRNENYQQHYIGPGANYLLTPDWEIGTRVFWGLSDDSSRFICNAGMGFRF